MLSQTKPRQETIKLIMEFIGLQILAAILASTSSLSAAAATILRPPPPPPPPNFPINCTRRCGNVSIPFPFGTKAGCYLNDDFLITCNRTLHPPKTFLGGGNIEVTDISPDGQLKVLYFIARNCYGRNRTKVYWNQPWIDLGLPFTVSNAANKFTVVGCDTNGFISGKRLDERDYETGCTATCASKDDLENGTCAGLGCCQMSLPKHVWNVDLTLKSKKNYKHVWDFNDCGFAFVAEKHAFNFSTDSLTSLKNVEMLPMVVDWAIGNETCDEAGKNASAYACKSVNSACYQPNNGHGYRCSCLQGYEGNPYLPYGCRDINECQDPKLHDCKEHNCKNTPGNYTCFCPKGYHGDGKRNGQGCTRSESLVLKIVAGISLGIILVLLCACWLYMALQRRRLIKMRQHFFLQNGGILLQEKLRGREGSPDMAKIFSKSELDRATNYFQSSMIVGQGGYGTVYKGFLPDDRIIAIKKAKEVPRQIDQFTNEVIVLSQINHRNVVRLLGCCLETRVPLLVYEFLSNGTLYEHIHNKAKACFLSWDTRLRIATETASVLSYLHFSASIPIIHRDVKSSNILLDHAFTAKVSDFGASRLFPLDQKELTTLVQGTFGYLDPEYMQRGQLTEKSDVYSFGVVLVELLTGRKAVSHDSPEEERSLANFFLSVMKEEHLLLQVLEDNVRDGNKEQLMKVADLARRCLNVKGDERPSMKEVEVELEGLRVGVKCSSIETGRNGEDTESVLGDDGFSSFTSFGDTSTSIGLDSLKDHQTTPPAGGGRLLS